MNFRIVSIAAAALLAAACAGPKAELNIVTGYPVKKNAPQQANIKTDYIKPALTLRIGEPNPVRNLDPLFASNEAAQRVGSLVYEGLTGYDATGALVPVLASNWTYSPDSLEVTFTLRAKTFFHDDPQIGSGAGRLVTAADVKKVFERMAQDEVPSVAARLFASSIKGFDAFFVERQDVHDPQERRLTEIAGIQAKNDSTVVFYLNAPDRLFLNRLASPWAAVYPMEAVTTFESGLKLHPVGTGPYRFVQHSGDSLWAFQVNQAHRSFKSRPAEAVARVEFRVQTNENLLFRALVTDEIQVIADLGPLSARTLLKADGTLAEAYSGSYQLLKPSGSEPVRFLFNQNNFQQISRAEAVALIQLTPVDVIVPQLGSALFATDFTGGLTGAGSISRLKTAFPPGGTGAKIYLSFENDHFSRFVCRALGTEWNKSVGIQLVQTSVRSRDIPLHASRPVAYLPENRNVTDPDLLFSIRTSRYLLLRSGITGVQVNRWSWWLDLSSAVIPVPKELQP